MKPVCVYMSDRTEGLDLWPVLGQILSWWQKCFSVCEFNICPNQQVILEKPVTQQLKKGLQSVSSGGQLIFMSFFQIVDLCSNTGP